MAEVPAGPGGSPGPAPSPSPQGSAGPEQEERCPGGARPEAGGAEPDPDPGQKAADAEAFLKPPPSKKGTPGSSSRKKRPASSPKPGKSPLRSSPSKEQTLNSFSLSPIIATPQGKRRSWCRSSLKGSKSRRKSLPPVHQDVTELSKSISLELPESQRLSSLLLSSFQFSARKLEQILEQTEGFSPEAFAAKVQVASEELERLIQRLSRDGTLRDCVEPPQGNSPDPALDESVAQVKQLMARFSTELQAWDQLLQEHQDRSQEASRHLEQLRSGSAPQIPGIPSSQIHVLSSKPDYGQILAQQGPVLRSLELVVDELQQAGRLAMAFSEESQSFLRGLSEQLASRAFRKLEESPVRRLLARPLQRTLPAEG